MALALVVMLVGVKVRAQQSDAQGKTDAQSKADTQNSKDTQSTSSQNPQDPNYDPRKDASRDKQRQKNGKALKQELSKEYKKWLDEDVRWIITDEERSAFLKLTNDDERENFIESFWQRRDPTPDTIENEFKEEHFRRIAYANEHFAAGIPGWKTDRGQIYIKFGPPTEIDAHPSGGFYQRPAEEGGGTTSTFPFEVWRYRYLEGANLGNEVEIEFVDTCGCNEYHMTLDRSEKDALLHTPNAGLTTYEEMGLASKADRFSGGLENLGAGPFNQNLQSKEFDRIMQMAALQKAPDIKYADLMNESVTHKIRTNLLPFDLRMDFVKLTDSTVMVPVTVQVKNKNLTFDAKDGVDRSMINIYGRVTNMTGKIVQSFEDTVSTEVPAELLPKTLENASVYWKGLQLKPGHYKIDVIVKNGERTGIWTRGFVVPDMSEDRGLASSTLILADQMERVPVRSVGAGNFVIGTTKVRPRVEPSDGKPASFKRNQKLNFWMQVYNLSVDDKTKKSSATITYKIVEATTKKQIVQTEETTDDLGSSGDQLTLEKSLPLASLEPGVYELTIMVNDKIAKQTITPAAKFAVE